MPYANLQKFQRTIDLQLAGEALIGRKSATNLER